VPLVGQVSRYIISSGGKRLRPALLLLVCGALGYRGEQQYNLAAVVEFIHTATLLHDDVVDESTLRRGRATANESFGNPASVLVGDFLYSRAFQMMLDAHDVRVMEILAEATNIIAEGEVMQLVNMHDPELDDGARPDVNCRGRLGRFPAMECDVKVRRRPPGLGVRGVSHRDRQVLDTAAQRIQALRDALAQRHLAGEHRFVPFPGIARRGHHGHADVVRGKPPVPAARHVRMRLHHVHDGVRHLQRSAIA